MNDFTHMFAGTDAHRLLLEWLQSGSNGDQWSGNVTFDGLFGDGRPDLIYDPLKGPLSIFEIKPVGSDVAAQAQLQGYLDATGDAAVAGDPSLIFTHGPTLTLSGGWFGATYTYSPGEFPGTVVYQTEDQGSLLDAIKQLFSSRPNGAPLPLPPRLPPIPVLP